MTDKLQTTLNDALALLKRVENALYDQIDEDHPNCGWMPLYQEITDFLDSARANELNTADDLVRRVAEAIYERRMIRLHTHVPTPLQDWPEEYLRAYYDDARAAIDEMAKGAMEVLRV